MELSSSTLFGLSSLKVVNSYGDKGELAVLTENAGWTTKDVLLCISLYFDYLIAFCLKVITPKRTRRDPKSYILLMYRHVTIGTDVSFASFVTFCPLQCEPTAL